MSLTDDGLQANGPSREPSLAVEPGTSPGYGVAYESDATNLVDNDPNDWITDVYVAYSSAPIPWHVSARIGGTGIVDYTRNPAMTMVPDPDRVAFEFSAFTASGEDARRADVFLWQDGASRCSA